MTLNRESIWELPEPASIHEVQVDADTAIVLRRHGNSGGPRLILSHGNGLAIDLYYPFWSLLSDDFDLVLYDLRNHGWNQVSALESHNLPTLVNDHDLILDAIDEAFGVKPQVGVFHSLSALVTLLSPHHGGRYSALVLFDPPVCKPGRSHREFEAAAIHLSGIARGKTEKFQREEQLSEFLSLLPPYWRLVPGAVELMARTTLQESRDEPGYELRCPREYEAQMIDYASVYGVAVDFDTLVCPTKVIGADPTLPFSYLPTLDLSDMLNVDYDFLPDATHFLQLEKPADCAAVMRRFLRGIELA